jgi:glycosyltransferase involved in cell wall biosynthesis
LEWINEFNPDLIYSALGSLELVLLLKQIKAKTNRKIAIHIWDDWANKIYKNTLLSPILKYLFKKHVNDLFKEADICLSISEEMSITYKEKYGKDFIPFHNPVNIDEFSNKEIEKTNMITYIGKINKDTAPCLLQLAKAIEILNEKDPLLNFQLFTPNFKHKNAKKIQKRAHCTVLESVEHHKIPSILSKSQFLFLPLAFSKKSREYTKLSMPTKATEYMVSGSTTIIYAPPEIALSKHAKRHKWAFTIEKNGLNYLVKELKYIIQNKKLQNELIENAQNLVKKKYTSDIVREKFRISLLSKEEKNANNNTKNVVK